MSYGHVFKVDFMIYTFIPDFSITLTSLANNNVSLTSLYEFCKMSHAIMSN